MDFFEFMTILVAIQEDELKPLLVLLGLSVLIEIVLILALVIATLIFGVRQVPRDYLL